MNNSQEAKIRVENVYKVFGPNPNKAMTMLKDGLDKATIHEKTGMTVGVTDANFEIYAGEIFVLMGLSGSGKSTMVRMLNRLIEPTAGKVFVNDQDVTAMGDKELVNMRRQYMGMVFQSFALMPHLSVLDNAAFGLELSGVDKQTRSDRAMQALAQVGLEGYEHSKPRELSGGMQQRVGLARGLAVNPDVLLMDEAFSALDPLIRTEMQDELLNLQAKEKRTIVFISHDLDEAMRIGDRIGIMEGGRVVQVGTPEDILQHPADEYVRAFFRGVDPTGILSIGDIARDTQVTVIRHPGEGPRVALQRLISHDRAFGYVLDPERKFLGIVSTDSLKQHIDDGGKDLSQTFLPDVKTALAADSMQDVLPEVATRPWPIPVLDERGKYMGVISKNLFLRTLQRGQEDQNQQS